MSATFAWFVFAGGVLCYLGSWRNVREASKLLIEAQRCLDESARENRRTLELQTECRALLDQYDALESIEEEAAPLVPGEGEK